MDGLSPTRGGRRRAHAVGAERGRANDVIITSLHSANASKVTDACSRACCGKTAGVSGAAAVSGGQVARRVCALACAAALF